MYCWLGGLVGWLVAINHVWGLVAYIILFSLCQLTLRCFSDSGLKTGVKSEIEKHEGKMRAKFMLIKANVKRLGVELTAEEYLRWLQRADLIDDDDVADADDESSVDVEMRQVEDGRGRGITMANIFGGPRRGSGTAVMIDNPIAKDANT